MRKLISYFVFISIVLLGIIPCSHVTAEPTVIGNVVICASEPDIASAYPEYHMRKLSLDDIADLDGLLSLLLGNEYSEVENTYGPEYTNEDAELTLHFNESSSIYFSTESAVHYYDAATVNFSFAGMGNNIRTYQEALDNAKAELDFMPKSDAKALCRQLAGLIGIELTDRYSYAITPDMAIESEPEILKFSRKFTQDDEFYYFAFNQALDGIPLIAGYHNYDDESFSSSECTVCVSKDGIVHINTSGSLMAVESKSEPVNVLPFDELMQLAADDYNLLLGVRPWYIDTIEFAYTPVSIEDVDGHEVYRYVPSIVFGTYLRDDNGNVNSLMRTKSVFNAETGEKIFEGNEMGA